MPRAVNIIDPDAALLVPRVMYGVALGAIRRRTDEQRAMGCGGASCEYSSSCTGEHDDCPYVREASV